MENFKNVYKILAYKFVIGLVASALCFVLVLPEINGIWYSGALQTLLSDVRDFFTAITDLDGERLSLIKDKLFCKVMLINLEIKKTHQLMKFLGGCSNVKKIIKI